MTGWRVVSTLAALVGTSPGLHAQFPRLEGRVAPAIRAAVEPVLDSARAAGLPIEPLENKVLEGVTKDAGPLLIAAAVRRLAGELAQARTALGDRATERELVAGAGALRAGLTPDELTRLRVARSGRGTAVALEVATDLITQGVASDTATRLVISVLQAGASDADLVQLRLGVSRDVATGVAASVAASVRARALGGTDLPSTPKPPDQPH